MRFAAPARLESYAVVSLLPKEAVDFNAETGLRPFVAELMHALNGTGDMLWPCADDRLCFSGASHKGECTGIQHALCVIKVITLSRED